MTKILVATFHKIDAALSMVAETLALLSFLFSIYVLISLFEILAQ